jgi:selenide,water dikinase
LGPGDLKAMLGSLAPRADKRILVDMNTVDDAGAVRLDADRGLLHTIDVITPIVDDPETFGRVAAANAVSDIFAMGGQPMSAVSFLAVPKDLPPRALGPMLRGAEELLFSAGAMLIGGHTVKDSELKLGFAVTGIVRSKKMTTVAGAKPKDVLVLTKPLGTGVLYQAMKNGLRTAKQTRALVASMTTLNDVASAAMIEARVRCATDVTGFGLAGHALNIARASNVDVMLDASALPTLPGVMDYLGQGVEVGPTQVNLNGYGRQFAPAKTAPRAATRLAADPQTSGGLLMAVSPRRAEALAAELSAWIIGEVRPCRGKAPAVRMEHAL